EAYDIIEKYMKATDEEAAASLENLKGEIMFRHGKIEKALQHFKNARSLNPELLKPVLYSAEIFRSRENLEAAEQAYRKAVDIDSDNVDAMMGLGYINDIKGNTERAEQFYSRILDIDPFHAPASNNLAFILAEKETNLDRALKLARFARQKRPEDPNVLDTLGWVYYKKGSFGTAVSELEESLKINPDNPLARYHLGMCLYRSGKYEDARKQLKRALNIDPDFKGAHSAKEMLN
ncbi:MAG: tetratricopeptide repeat protein, partial [Desulfobacteraceae bacterium]